MLFGCGSEADITVDEVVGKGANFTKVSLEEGRVLLQDFITERTFALKIGESYDISNAVITLKSKSA